MPHTYGSLGLQSRPTLVEPVRPPRAPRTKPTRRVPPRRRTPLSPYVRLLKPMPRQWRRPGEMGPIKRISLWKILWREHRNQWIADVVTWLAEQRMALTESARVGPHASERKFFDGP